MEESWKNIIGNLYQCILGSHEEKTKVITKWLKDIKNDPVHSINIDHIVELYSEQYRT